MGIKAYATFRQIGDEIYRTNTYIQFGSSKKSIGAVVMLNPGSSVLTGEARLKLIQKGSYTSETKLDSTMKQLIQFMKETHPEKLEGRLHIYNLFYIKKTKNIEAIELFELLKSTGKYPTVTLPCLHEMKRHPWILIGWGVETRRRWKYYEVEKRKWLQLIKESDIPYFGVISDQNEYYHPNPNSKAKIERLEQLIQVFKNKLEPRLVIRNAEI